MTHDRPDPVVGQTGVIYKWGHPASHRLGRISKVLAKTYVIMLNDQKTFVEVAHDNFTTFYIRNFPELPK